LLMSGNMLDAFNVIIKQSGFRFISVYASYSYVFGNLMGAGVGNWELASLDAMRKTGFTTDEITFFKYHHDGNFVGVRPTSYFANMVLDFGIFAVPFILILSGWFKGFKSVPKPILVLFFFSFFLMGTVGNPIPWIVAALAIRGGSRA